MGKKARIEDATGRGGTPGVHTPSFFTDTEYPATLTTARALELAQTLVKKGVVVVPVLTTLAERRRAWDDVRATLLRLPEYVASSEAKDKAGFEWTRSTFGALGTASSFHNRFVRDLRQRALQAAIPLFRELRALQAAELGDPACTADQKLEMIVDRLRVMRPGTAPTEETWHRDFTPLEETQAGDRIFGGWINLDPDRNQTFSCINGSHRSDPLNNNAFLDLSYDARHAAERKAAAGGNSFTKLSAADQARVNEHRADWVRSVLIPPGCMVVFYADILHEIAPIKYAGREPFPSYRLFTGWRLTTDPQPLRSTNPPGYFDTMALPKLKSGQPATMFSWDGNWRPLVLANFEKWAMNTFQANLLLPIEFKGRRILADVPADEWPPHLSQVALADVPKADGSGKTFKTYPRTVYLYHAPEQFPSLTEVWELLQTPQAEREERMARDFPPYSPEERALYRPATEWHLSVRGQEPVHISL